MRHTDEQIRSAGERFRDRAKGSMPRYRELNSPLWDVLNDALVLADTVDDLHAEIDRLTTERDQWKLANTEAYELAERAENALRDACDDIEALIPALQGGQSLLSVQAEANLRSYRAVLQDTKEPA